MFDSDLTADTSSRKTSRRTFLLSAATLGAGVYFLSMGIFSKKTETAEAGAKSRANETPSAVTIVEFTDAGERKETVHVPKVVKSDAQRAVLEQPRAGPLSLHLLWHGAVQLRHQV
jgi:hypothetical protein